MRSGAASVSVWSWHCDYSKSAASVCAGHGAAPSAGLVSSGSGSTQFEGAAGWSVCSGLGQKTAGAPAHTLTFSAADTSEDDLETRVPCPCHVVLRSVVVGAGSAAKWWALAAVVLSALLLGLVVVVVVVWVQCLVWHAFYVDPGVFDLVCGLDVCVLAALAGAGASSVFASACFFFACSVGCLSSSCSFAGSVFGRVVSSGHGYWSGGSCFQ